MVTYTITITAKDMGGVWRSLKGMHNLPPAFPAVTPSVTRTFPAREPGCYGGDDGYTYIAHVVTTDTPYTPNGED